MLDSLLGHDLWCRRSMENPKDYYRLLGVSRTASASAIRRAFRRLAKQHHPDAGVGSSVDLFREIQAAYETLTDAERRRRYDEALGRIERQRDRLEALSWSFVRSPTLGDLRRPVRPGSLSGEILLTPAEAAVGGVLPLAVPVDTHCRSCEGTGGVGFACIRCGGEGRAEKRFPVPVHVPAGVRDGTVFHVRVDDPSVLSILLTVHIRAL
jgi:DnaJ-class molecular chaperone